MIKAQNLFCSLLAISTLSGRFPADAHEEAVIVIGRSSNGEIRIHNDFDQPVTLPKSIYRGISGYATGELGVHSTLLDEPDEDLFQLSTGADFRLVLIAKDPGMEVWNDTGSAYLQIGQSFYVGPSPFDTHPIWNLVAGLPGSSYSLTLKVHDINGVYADSESFTVSFTPPGLFEINIRPIDASQFTLSWSTNAVDWKIRSAASLNATNWTSVTNLPVVAGTNFSLTLPANSEQQFFRLSRQ